MSANRFITICGEVFSNNLGDGIIAASLAYLIRKTRPDLTLRWADLSDRSSTKTDRPGGKSNSGTAPALPSPRSSGWLRAWKRGQAYRRLRNLVRWRLRERRRMRQLWRPNLRGSSLAIIGGGQLLMDNALNFPLRVAEIVRCCRENDVKVAFHACGVEPHMSLLGKGLLHRALTNPIVSSISVRHSGDALRQLFPELRAKTRVVWDPALCAPEALGIAPGLPQRGLVGLGVIGPNVLRGHPAGLRGIDREEFLRFWQQLALQLTQRGYRVALFSNGNPGDHSFAEKVAATLVDSAAEKSSVILLPRPESPGELVSLISQCQGIVAFRLHANIVAYALGRPAVGISWDEKLLEFGRFSGREEFFLSYRQADARLVVESFEEAVRRGVDRAALAAQKDAAQREVEEMLAQAGL